MQLNSIKTNRNNNSQSPKNQLILLVYWFISNKHNSTVFEYLKQLQTKMVDIPLRIVCLNPFNGQEDINLYKKSLGLDFEMEYDEKRTSMFYHINTFPSFILMEKSGKIIHRENGLSEDCFHNLDNTIVKNYANHIAEKPQQKGRIIPIENYKNNLSMLFKKI